MISVLTCVLSIGTALNMAIGLYVCICALNCVLVEMCGGVCIDLDMDMFTYMCVCMCTGVQL